MIVQNYNSENDLYKLYLKGVVLDTKTNSIICLPPIVSLDLNDDSHIENQNNTIYQFN